MTTHLHYSKYHIHIRVHFDDQLYILHSKTSPWQFDIYHFSLLNICVVCCDDL